MNPDQPHASPRPGRGRPANADSIGATVRDFTWLLTSMTLGVSPAEIARAEPEFSDSTVRRGIDAARSRVASLFGITPDDPGAGARALRNASRRRRKPTPCAGRA